MIALLLSTIVLALAFGGCVVAANPRRRSNRLLAADFFLLVLWLGCVHQVVQSELQGVHSLGWTRANVVVAAWFPLLSWLLKESIVAPHASRRQLLRRARPWLAITLVAAALPFLDTFVLAPAHPGGAHGRGWPYFTYVALALAAYLAIVAEAASSLRRQKGVQRLELQFLVLCIVGVGVTTLVLNGLGNLLQVRALKLSGVPIVLIGLTVTAWAITFHRIFNARQVLLRFFRRLGTLAILTVCVFGGQHLLPPLVETPLDLLTGIVLGGILALWFERKSIAWFRLEGDPPLAAMRAAVIAAAKTESDFRSLVGRLESLLRQWCEAPAATLLFSETDGHRGGGVFLARDHAAHATLCALGWSTPESLQRRRFVRGLDDLRDFLAQHALGLALTVPHGSPQPSLILAIGVKTTGAPFTFPEVERLKNVAELMDNILSHARLTTQAALAARTEHLAMMSRGLAHDLKNLLTPVSSFLVHTEDRFPTDSAEAEVHAAARHSVRVMSDYVREARFFAEQLAPRLELCHLRALCVSACDVVRPRADARRLTLTAHVPVDHLALLDGVLLQRLLANLLSNAIDASPAGSTILVSAAVLGPHFVFAVTDHGCGIPAENLTRIFEPYFTTKEFGDDVRGFGLGLTICQKIAALHEGTLSVRSEVGRGSTFTVTLPHKPAGSATLSRDFALSLERPR